jgi:hypothetical protein
MKKIIHLFAITLYCISSYGQCEQNVGIDYNLGTISSNTPNFLLGTAITITSPFNLTAMGFISIGSGENYKVAVYNNAGGSPGSLVTQGAGTAVEGTNITDVPDVLLTPGTYYFMAVFETTGNISTASMTNSTVWYIPHPFSDPLPEFFGTPLTYANQNFSYYFIGTGPSALGTDTQTACSSFTWIDGNTYTSNNSTATFNIAGGAANGCDSLVTLNLTINNPATGTHTVTACSSYTWIDGNTYTSNNNTATFNIAGGAANGCDSLVTLNLTINNPATGTHTVSACSSYSWIDGNTYTSNNNTATFNIAGGAANGCDSLVTLNLTINNPATGTHTVTACNSYTWIDGNTYTSNNNTATFNIAGGAANGCDSLVTLNLTIHEVDTSVTIANNSLTANASGAGYQWLDCNDNFSVISGATNQTFSPTINGNYAVSVTQNNCTDTSSCYIINTIGIDEFDQNTHVFIFPNPFTSEAILQSEVHLTDVTLTVVNSVGQTVYQINNIHGKMVTIQRNALPAGLYFVQLTDNHQRIATKTCVITD